MPKEQLYYVHDTRQGGCVGNCALWWGKDRKGYTTQLEDAGLYTADEVRGMRETDVGWPKEFVESIAVRHVRVEPMREYDTVKTVKGR